LTVIMETLRQDLRYALRRLSAAPMFTAIAVLTLAIGIGANAAIFTVVNAVVLQPLPYAEPDRLVGVFHSGQGSGELAVMSPPNFLDARRLNRSLEDMAGIDESGFTLTGAGDPVRLEGASVSAGFFELLRVRPILGRTFRADENESGKHKVALLSHGLWVRRFGGESGVVGRSINIDGTPFTVVGVMPAGFSYPETRDLWVPLEYDERFRVSNRGAWYLQVVGRLKPGVSAEAASADVAAIAVELARQFPKSNTDLSMAVAPLHGWIVDRSRTALLLLLGAVGFVLLIACANVANLTLARAATREGELAVRAALGARRGRLVRQLLTESAVLAVAGGILGLLVAAWGSDALVRLEPDGVPRLTEVAVNPQVMAFTAVVSMLTGLLVGSLPAWQITRGALVGALREGGRGALTGRRGTRMRHGLVVAEMALAVVLLAGAGLLINSFIRLQHVNPGFHVGDALTFRLALPETAYDTRARRVEFYDRALAQLRALPGVRTVGGVMGLPLSGLRFNISFDVEGRPPAQPGKEPSMQVRVATPDYFKALGIPLTRGRLFTDADRFESPQVVLLSEAAAREYFPGENPLGRRIVLGWNADQRRAGGEVIGVVGDVKDLGLDEPAPAEIYLPHPQMAVGQMTIVLRSDVPTRNLAALVTRTVHELDPNLPISSLRSLDEIVARSVSQPRFYMLLLGAFAVAALLLAAIGIFGVMSYAVTQQTREFGIRIALGADGRAIVRMVLARAMLLITLGLGLGVAGALVVGRALSTLLFDVSPRDPVTLLAVVGLLASVAFLASYLPARRATRVDPIVALRAD
jgi:putative ABC transport system permease protein